MTPGSTPSRSPFPSRKVRAYTPFVVLATGTLLSALAFAYIRREEASGREREFLRRAQNVALRAEDYLQRREETLYTLRDYFDYSGQVTRAEFSGFTRDLLSRQVGIRALEWMPVVPAAERARYESEARTNGFPSYQFTERATGNELRRAADRPIHAPVYYLEPYAGNEQALGFDMTSDPAWPRLQKYAEAGELHASGRVPLLVTPGKPPTWGYITVLPVYRRPFAQLDPKDRAVQLRGFVLGIFDLSDVLEEMFRRMGGLGIDALFLDATATPDRALLHYHPAVPNPPGTLVPTAEEFSRDVHANLPLQHAGRQWNIWMRPSVTLLAGQTSYRSWFFGTLFLSITVLLSHYLRTQLRRTQVIERLVSERTAELTESKRKLDSFLHALPGMAYRGTYDEQFDIIFISEGARALTGYEPEEFLSRRVHLRDFIHPDDLPRVRAVTHAGFEQRREVEVEYRIRTRGGAEKWVLSRGRGIHATGSTPVFEGLAIDITAQKRAEQERLAIERKLLEGQKLESLGLLAGGIAHDFNNLLTGVLGNASIARLASPGGAPVEPQLRAIEHAALRAAELCRQMLAYAGKGRFVVESLDLTLLAEGLLPLLNTSIAQRAELRLHVARDLPAVMADATQIRQIVMNLVLNAADAISGADGRIALTTGVMKADRAFLDECVTGKDLPAGDYVYLEVGDNGCGMSPDVLAKIFDPFFTTKFAGRGLGLAAALGIVRGHGGALHVRSLVGQGSRFRLLLPPTESRGALPTAAVPAEAAWRRAGHVLVIDDDEAVRLVAAEMLKMLGLTPRVTADGHAGLAAFREAPRNYDLVLLDLMMPAMSGEETLAAIRAIRPDMPVLLMSGYSEGDVLSRLSSDRARLAFLPKPFTRDVLVAKLRAVLD